MINPTVASERLASKCVNACIILTLLLVGMVICGTGGPWILPPNTSSQLREGHHFKAVEFLSLGEHQLLQGNAISLGIPLSQTTEIETGRLTSGLEMQPPLTSAVTSSSLSMLLLSSSQTPAFSSAIVSCFNTVTMSLKHTKNQPQQCYNATISLHYHQTYNLLYPPCHMKVSVCISHCRHPVHL